MPTPWYLRFEEPSACQKRSKTYGRFFSEMPIPVSDTVSTSSSACLSARTSTLPPEGVNFSALKTKLSRIFSNLSRSASTSPTDGSTNVSRRNRLSSATCRAALARPLTKSATSTGSRLTSIRPDSSRTRSSKSLINFNRRMPLECMVPRSSLVSRSRLKRCSKLSSGAISKVRGVRSSWLMLAKNRLLI